MKDQTFFNKIEAADTTINKLLKDQKFYIDYFQREYRWQENHMTLLIEDLTSTFLSSYNKMDERKEVAKYQNYYIGPVVFSEKDGKKSIIDGQQRITSITLFLIYLNHRQANIESKVSISEMIYSEKFGVKSFNMTDESRQPCLKGLYEKGEYTLSENDDETIMNMVERYNDIDTAFPEEIDDHALPYFIDWLTELVVIVEITAYSEQNAYTIFETMNDRGLNLTPSEMLKGYVLSRITDSQKRMKVNELWKKAIQKLHTYSETSDQKFFQSWFRSKFASSMRSSKAGSVDKDFELIGSRFHSWFKDNHVSVFELRNSDQFFDFFTNNFPFFVDLYCRVLDGKKTLNKDYPHLHYLNYWGIAESLEDAIIMASIKSTDDKETINRKIDFSARYIETFTVQRSINFRKFNQSSIKYSMFNLIKKIRNNSLQNLSKNLIEEVNSIDEKWDGFLELRMHGQNKKFVKHLLSRFSSFVDKAIGLDTSYASYRNPNGRQYEIEHIWNSDYQDYQEYFDQENDFNIYRNKIGALVLLPNGTNQSYGKISYREKLEHYIKENTLVKTLHSKFYERNPNFLNSEILDGVNFIPHDSFLKEDIDRRQIVYKELGERIWSTNYFELN
jgi:uncharacterized protein with ParB-like and HNH nuclease domain